jgi:ribonucleoside-diphosphate reductase alpha chain
VVREVDARALWIRILTARIETGEPYLIFSDT